MPIRTTYTPFGRPAAYDVGEVLVELKAGGSFTIHLPAGYYEISVIGAGGGAGGGTYKSGNKTGGGGGGSGAGFIGVVWLSGGEYIFQCGKSGAGGSNARTYGSLGEDGGDSFITLLGENLIFAQGGAGGLGGRTYTEITPTGRIVAEGGKLSINSKIRIESFVVKSNGNNGQSWLNTKPGAAVDGVHGAGGSGVYKEYGLPGGNGYIKVAYLGLDI